MIENSQFDDITELLLHNSQLIYDGILGTATPVQVGASMAFAKYIQHVGITTKNYTIFLKTLETNNKWIVDELVGRYDPRLLFTSIKANSRLIKYAFEQLSIWHPGQIYEKVLLAILGIIEYSYFKPDDGYNIYRLDIQDLHNLGKFLNEDRDQEDVINATILDCLDRITLIGSYDHDITKNNIANHSFNIRDAYFDHTKSLGDIIPRVLLIRVKREDREVAPPENYLDFRQNKSDD
ncbi:MAG: hypothetical protein JEZ04_00755 [Spirochaetales bacterium]|nr:hypothetical protein [Spirochaetales bacterium]